MGMVINGWPIPEWPITKDYHVKILESGLKLNPVTFLPTEERPLDHDCKEVMDAVYSSRSDLMDASLSDPELKLFTDGFAITTANDIIQAEALTQGWSAQ
jgi:hypothetical protein